MFSFLPEEINELIFSYGGFRKDLNLFIGTISDEDERCIIISDLYDKKINNYCYEEKCVRYFTDELNTTIYKTGAIIPCNWITGRYLHIQQTNWINENNGKKSYSMTSSIQSINQKQYCMSKYTRIRSFISRNSCIPHYSDSDDESIVSFHETFM